MADEIVSELNRLFASGDDELNPMVIAELKSIMRLHDLSAQDMFYKWESYCIKMDLDELKLSVDSLRPFKQDLMDALEKSHRTQAHIKSEKRVGATPRNVTKSSDVYGMLEGLTTPGGGKLNRPGSTKKRGLETPSVSRVKNYNQLSSSPDYKSPARLEDQLNSLGAVPPSSFIDRPNPGEIIEVLNDHLEAGEPPIAPFPEARIKLTAGSDQKKLAYKPLAMKLSEASEILDDRIDSFAVLIAEHHSLDEATFENAASQHTDEVVAVGRIATDSLEAGKPNAASVVLEMSRRMGGGARVHLNLDKLKGYQVFPGQIVALRGRNATGNTFTVSEVLSIPLLPNAASTPTALAAHRKRLRGNEGPDAMDMDENDTSEPPRLNVMFAAGPYTADDNLDYEPLHELCGRAADTFADALVLVGPFVDTEHPLIATGDFDLPEEALAEPDTLTMASVFKYLVSPALNRFVAANPHATVVLIPSVRDVLAKHVSWPQDGNLGLRRELGLHKGVRVVGNPMTLSLNEAVVGISAQDVLAELRTEELAGGPGGPPERNLLARLAKHLIEQRHYFPLFPPVDRAKLPKTGTPSGLPPGAMLDLSYLKLGEMLNVRPDVLVVPSTLPPFAKVIESVLVINPGTLSKRRAAGTYAKMILHAPKLSTEQLTSGAMIGNQVFGRARIEITRI